jgi:hypothetical protein
VPHGGIVPEDHGDDGGIPARGAISRGGVARAPPRGGGAGPRRPLPLGRLRGDLRAAAEGDGAVGVPRPAGGAGAGAGLPHGARVGARRPGLRLPRRARPRGGAQPPVPRRPQGPRPRRPPRPLHRPPRGLAGGARRLRPRGPHVARQRRPRRPRPRLHRRAPEALPRGPPHRRLAQRNGARPRRVRRDGLLRAELAHGQARPRRGDAAHAHPRVEGDARGLRRRRGPHPPPARPPRGRVHRPPRAHRQRRRGPRPRVDAGRGLRVGHALRRRAGPPHAAAPRDARDAPRRRGGRAPAAAPAGGGRDAARRAGAPPSTRPPRRGRRPPRSLPCAR